GELDRAAERITVAGREGQRVLLASGHPTGIMVLWQGVGRALAAAGAKRLRIADGQHVVPPGHDFETKFRMVRYVGGVAVLSSGADLYHTHSSRPWRRCSPPTARAPTWCSPTTAGPARRSSAASRPSRSPTSTTRRSPWPSTTAARRS